MILVGHSYGGVVITNASTMADNVVGLVYVAAFLPDEEEMSCALAEQATDSLLGANLRPAVYPLPDGSEGHERLIDTAALPRRRGAPRFSGRGSIRAGGVAAPWRGHWIRRAVEKAGWKTIPSWAVVATADMTIGVSGLRLMAERAGAITWKSTLHIGDDVAARGDDRYDPSRFGNPVYRWRERVLIVAGDRRCG